MENLNQFTNILFQEQAREQLLVGLETAAAAIGCTLGPKGKTVLIQEKGKTPLITKDGVTVSKSIKLKNPIQRIGADLLKEAANKTNE
jgi:chaperonin GroEL